MTMLRQDSTKTLVKLGQKLNKGGEGTVYATENPLIAAKVYIGDPTQAAAKLRVMLAHPPKGAPTRLQKPIGHISLAWPLDLLLNERGATAGFLMPLIDIAESVPLRDVYHPGARGKAFPTCTWKDLVHICANTAAVMASLHQNGRYIVGDFHESNILVFRDSKLVTFVDCDSMQVSDKGRTMLCTVGKSEYLAPELQSKPLHLIARTKAQDVFSLAVLIFMMLMQGVHPFDGSYTDDAAATREYKIAHYAWPYEQPNPLGTKSRKGTLLLSFLPRNIQDLMRRCFLDGLRHPELRPSAEEWHHALLAAESNLQGCSKNNNHYSSGDLPGCGWCQYVVQKGYDPFPNVAPRQLAVVRRQ